MRNRTYARKLDLYIRERVNGLTTQERETIRLKTDASYRRRDFWRAVRELEVSFPLGPDARPPW